jgi:hypothetical protein
MDPYISAQRSIFFNSFSKVIITIIVITTPSIRHYLRYTHTQTYIIFHSIPFISTTNPSRHENNKEHNQLSTSVVVSNSPSTSTALIYSFFFHLIIPLHSQLSQMTNFFFCFCFFTSLFYSWFIYFFFNILNL